MIKKNEHNPDTEKMKKILDDLKKKMEEVDTEKKALDKKKIPKFDPLKAKTMIEEIIVPKLELIKDKEKHKTIKMKI